MKSYAEKRWKHLVGQHGYFDICQTARFHASPFLTEPNDTAKRRFTKPVAFDNITKAEKYPTHISLILMTHHLSLLLHSTVY